MSFLQASAGAAGQDVVPKLPAISFEDIFIRTINFFFDVAGADYQHTIDVLLFSVRFFSIFLSLLFIIGTIYARMQAAQIEVRRHQRTAPKKKNPADNVAAADSEKQQHAERWARVEEHVGSPNESDCRLAVLEADIILDDMLKAMGTFGDTISDRLKTLSTQTLPSIQKAWEAHLVRNQIAHEGENFKLSQHEARRVIGLFESVLKEGGFI